MNFKTTLPVLLVGIATVSAVALLLEGVEKNYSEMANAHDQFLEFEKAVSITTAKKKRLIAARTALQRRVVDYFKNNTPMLVPKFYIQGSYKMGTMVIGKDGTYDVDLGIYFLTKPTVEPQSLQNYVLNAVNSHTPSGAQHREKCVRVIYKAEFDIDLPVYYKTERDNHPFLATKNKWLESDPKEVCDWFENKKDKNGQLMRLVKYFKAWANAQDKPMPSGIAFTVWVAKNYRSDKRDDIAFYETAKAIEDDFGVFFTTKVWCPATPGDNLLDKLKYEQKNNFEAIFKQMIKEAKQALEQNRVYKSCDIWRNLFGEKFPVE